MMGDEFFDQVGTDNAHSWTCNRLLEMGRCVVTITNDPEYQPTMKCGICSRRVILSSRDLERPGL